MIIGLTRATTKNHIIRATLESIAFQTADVIELMENSTKIRIKGLKVDGGASANNLLMSFQADILDVLIERPSCIETTALGAAYMCGLTLGVYASINEIIATRCNDRKFTPAKNEEWRKARITEWKKAVNRCLGWKE